MIQFKYKSFTTNKIKNTNNYKTSIQYRWKKIRPNNYNYRNTYNTLE